MKILTRLVVRRSARRLRARMLPKVRSCRAKPASSSRRPTGESRRVRLEVRTDRIVRVTAVADENLELPKSLMVVDIDGAAAVFKVEKRDGDVVLATAQLMAHVSLANGAVRFTDPAGKPLLEEMPCAPARRAGVSQRFNPGTDEAFYGFGQHQNAQMNLNGEDVELAQHNMDIGVPFVVSSRNYGVLWDNNSITRFGNPKPYGLASRDLKIRDAERQGRRLHRALFHRRCR